MKTPVLTHDPLWSSASKLCEYAYSLLDSFPEDERYGMESDLREHGFNLTSDIAEALASLQPHDSRHYFEHARRDIFGLKNVLTMAKRVGFIKLDADMMLSLDSLSDRIAASIAEAAKSEEAARRQHEQELVR